MKYYFKSNAFKIVCGTILIVLGVLLYSSIDSKNNVITNTCSAIASPFQKCAAYVSDGISGFFGYFEEKDRLKEENASLKREISELRDITVDYHDVKRENARFAKYYDFKKANNSLKFVSASVIGRYPNEFFGDFAIDHGTGSGISKGDAVITENGLVGTVCNVSFSSARVKTILSPDSKIGVYDSVTGDSGVISGTVEKAAENLTRMNFIPAQSQMKNGDIVVTGGLSGLYPKNLKIGKISEISYDDYESAYYATLEPFENLKEIKDVFVITDFQGKGEISLLASE